jgi:hypothetical protein
MYIVTLAQECRGNPIRNPAVSVPCLTMPYSKDLRCIRQVRHIDSLHISRANVTFILPAQGNYFLAQSDLDSTRGSGVPNFKKISAYNRGLRSKEVYPILASNFGIQFWHPITAKVTDFDSGRQTTYLGCLSTHCLIYINR